MGCFALIPSDHWRFAKEQGECLLPEGHDGYHLNKLNNGQYLSWGGNGCDEQCNWCGECWCWLEMDEQTAQEIISGREKNFDD